MVFIILCNFRIKTNFYINIFKNIFCFVIYYYIFRFLITKLNLKTPGRGNATKLYTKGEYNEAHEKGKDIDLEKKLN